ncbi:F-box/LRR-repeat protein At1g67190-like [Rhodamnia argentea]|uniref:F-box/LRR-repeat protein At1g67190-like n=1 Tax=Rhodamnia argentea TaxID=178133 RepID=A0A8B8NFG0_9MYRT|nr:F-box/LRR-repeat protein At1g67190-like [Rhodamnia argentea]
MESLPIEVIGNILSRLAAARDVVVASATCRKWLEARRKHLRSLSFSVNDWSGYRDYGSNQAGIWITQTIFETAKLQSLSLQLDDVDEEFSASAVVAWLLYTRETLRSLHYDVRVTGDVNILEICGRQKLEVLVLSHSSVSGVEPNYCRFPGLKSLSLSYVRISALDLSLLVSTCPKLEKLDLISPDIAMSDAQVTVEVSSVTLRCFYIEATSLDKFVLEADNIECLHLKRCFLELFELIGKGTLKHFIIDDVGVLHLDIGDTVDNLEIVDVRDLSITSSKFLQMISKSAKLRRLRLWDVMFDDEDEIVGMETIALRFPQLTHLSLNCDLRDGMLQYGFHGSCHFENVVVLELGWTFLNDLFSDWVELMLKRCPNLKKLVIHGVVSDLITCKEYQLLGSFTSAIVCVMREYVDLEVMFEYK